MKATTCKYYRLYLGFTQEELAIEVGLKQTTISRWEKGKQKMGIKSEEIIRSLVREKREKLQDLELTSE